MSDMSLSPEIEKIAGSEFFEQYFNELIQKLSLTDPLVLTDPRRREAVLEIVLRTAKERNFRLDNNYRNTVMPMNSTTLLDIILTKKPVMTDFNVLFHNREKRPNIPGLILEYLLKRRKDAKKEMFLHINDVDKSIYNKLNIEQNVLKVLANSYYGAFGEKTFHFFNPYLGPSVTYCGQSIIISSIMAFEGFLGDNFRFDTFDELIHYCYNIRASIREDMAEMSIIEEVTDADLNSRIRERFAKHCDFEMDAEQKVAVNNLLANGTRHFRELLFFKNNLYPFIGLESISNILLDVFDPEWLVAEKPTDSIKEMMHAFVELSLYYCGYELQHMNKEHKVHTLERQVVLISDTDSNFIYLDPFLQWYKKLLVSAGVPADHEYSKEEIMAITNIMTFTLSELVTKVFKVLTDNHNVLEADAPKINMKNEFLMSRVILTDNKKQYASVILAQEGNILKKVKYDLKGLQIKKVSTPKVARGVFTEILEEDILKSVTINPLVPFRKFLAFEKRIRTSLENCSVEFCKPGTFKKVEAYKFPLRMAAFRGILLWNALYPENPIPDFTSVNLLILKDIGFDVSMSMLPEAMQETIRESYLSQDSEMERRIQRAAAGEADVAIDSAYIEGELKKFGLTTLALPKTLKAFPDEFKTLVDYDKLVNDVTNNGNILLESLGFYIAKSLSTSTVSNVLQF